MDEIEMLEILQLEDKTLPLVRQFLALYEAAFPDANEREDPAKWTPLLSGVNSGQASPVVHVIVALSKGAGCAQGTVVAGVVFEYYTASRCGLVTYVVVHPGWRKRGIGKRLLQSALQRLADTARNYGGLAAVFAEAENPTDCPPHLHHEEVVVRCDVLRRLGAKWVQFPYVQPALSGQQVAAFHLMLLVVPSSLGCAELSGAVLAAFLREFYGCEAEHQDERVMAQLEQALARFVDLPVPLAELPSMESPVLRSSACTVTLHAVVANGPELAGRRGRSFFSSFETDLLALSAQRLPRPLCTAELTLRPIPVTICFPPFVQYNSEGRIETIIASRARIDVLLGVAVTKFCSSGRSILHVSFAPDSGWMTEYDIIKLQKQYLDYHEETSLSVVTRFLLRDGRSAAKMMTLTELLREVVPELASMEGELAVCAGSICLDMMEGDLPSATEVPLTWQALLQLLVRTREGDVSSKFELSQLFRESSLVAARLKALCGVVTGIFDFTRLGFAELQDTLESSTSGSDEIIRLHRSTITSITIDDDVLAQCMLEVCCSPYIIIPHAVVIHNDMIVRDALNATDKDLLYSVASKDIPRLEEVRDGVGNLLNADFVRDVFQYPTERALMEAAEKQRGFPSAVDSIRSRIAALGEVIESLYRSDAQRSQFRQALLLGFLSGLQAQSAVFLAMEPGGTKPLQWIVFGVVLMVIVIGVSVTGQTGGWRPGRGLRGFGRRQVPESACETKAVRGSPSQSDSPGGS